MYSGLADFIERNAQAIVGDAIAFARTVEVEVALDEAELRDHLPEIINAIVADLRTAQSRAEEIEKSEGRAELTPGRGRSAAATHAIHRAHSGYSVSHLVSEYRALRASVLRRWADHGSGPLHDIARFNEAIDEAIADSVLFYSQEVERWRNIFLGVLGHDLRSPLSAIMLTSQTIARMAVDAPIAEAAQRLIRSGSHMRELLDKLLVYNRAQLGSGFEVERIQVDLTQACRDEIELLRQSMPAAIITFEPRQSVRGKFDAGRLREVLANLVVNAFRYGREGGEIAVALQTVGSEAELSVTNEGEAIGRGTLDVLFEPLRRGGISDSDSPSNLGLGLFIVKQIAQAHGGSVSAASEGERTTFRLNLPLDGFPAGRPG